MTYMYVWLIDMNYFINVLLCFYKQHNKITEEHHNNVDGNHGVSTNMW